MSIILDGNIGLTYPDVTTQNTSAIISGRVPLAKMPVGSVLQVVNAYYGTAVSVSSSTYIDTGLTATITPQFATSKILVLIAMNDVERNTNSTYAGFRLVRDGSSILIFSGQTDYTGSSTATTSTVALTYLDSPAATSALVYKVQFNSVANNAAIKVQANNNQSSWITLMEIAQ
jgi:hypothetical protein